jgi:hypothetical protein
MSFDQFFDVKSLVELLYRATNQVFRVHGAKWKWVRRWHIQERLIVGFWLVLLCLAGRK